MKTEILKDSVSAHLERAAEIIKNGGLVAFPTETVYGLGANALDAEAVKNIFKAKGRPQDNPLIIHISDESEAEKYAYVSPLYFKLARRFTPGPLTVIMPKKDTVPSEVTAGLDSVAVRIPEYQPARELIRLSGVPIAAPSANISGKPSPTKAEHVITDMNGRIDAILCGADCKVGVESTIVVLTGEDSLTVCRPGGISPEMLMQVCKNVDIDPAVLSKFDGKPISPGMKYRHYAPDAEVELLNGTEEQVISFLQDKTDFAVICFDEDTKILKFNKAVPIGRSNDFEHQASKIFACLRDLDKDKEIKHIYARMPDKNGVGLAVYNRLIKAAGFNVITL